MKHIRRLFGWRFPAGLTVLVVLAVVLGLSTGMVGSATAHTLENVGLRASAPSTIDPAELHQPEPQATPAPAPAGVAGPATAEPGARADLVQSRIGAVGAPPGSVFARVMDAGSGEVMHDSQAEQVAVPASTMKILTSLAVLDGYGAGHRFTTEVRGDAADPGRLWIVGGGDPYLSRQDLDGLADRTAESLRGEGIARVDLGVDTSAFAGEAWNPVWTENYRSFVAPTEALWVDRARLGEATGPREAAPADAAGRAFADALRARGIEVGGVTPGEAPAAESATSRATVESKPLASIVETVMVESDNDAAEVLFRHVGRLDNGDGSIVAAQERLQAHLTERGLWTDGMVVSDGSGLSRDNRVSPTALTGALSLALADEEPDLRPVIAGLPTAGAEGTLDSRFVEPGTEGGRGLVRAKTGTLRGVHSLAGQVRTQDGSILVFAFLLNGDPGADYASRVWLDRVTTELAGCGCR